MGIYQMKGIVAAGLALGLALLGGCTGSASSDDATAQSAAPGSTGSPTDPNAPAPTLSLSAATSELNAGGTTILNWSATDADDCTASGGWSGSRSQNGSETIGPLSVGTTFTLSCTGPGGNALQMISVSVIGPVQLSWVAPDENVDGSQLTDLSGFRIYYGVASRSYSDMVELGDPLASNHTLNLASGDYFVAMTALDADGNESGYSNEVLKTRL